MAQNRPGVGKRETEGKTSSGVQEMLRAVSQCLLSHGPACSQPTHLHTPWDYLVRTLPGLPGLRSDQYENTLLVESEARAEPSPLALMLGAGAGGGAEGEDVGNPRAPGPGVRRLCPI